MSPATSNYDSLKDKVVLITGAATGIGEAISREFLKHGSRLVRVSHRTPLIPLADRTREVQSRADVSKRKEVSRMIKQAVSAFGGIDVLVNNAGLMSRFAIEDYDEAKFLEMWNINFMGTLYTTLEALPHIKESKGRIINISSASGMGNTLAQSTYYAVTKAAVTAFSRRLAFEVGKYGVRVNVVAPGPVKSRITLGGMTEEDARRKRERLKRKTMLHMLGEPSHIAKVVSFLASDAADYMTGQVIVVDGGNFDYLTRSF